MSAINLATPNANGLNRLSFVTCRRANGSLNLWSPEERDGDWEAQCRDGRRYGKEFCRHLRDTENIPLLGSIVREIVARGFVGGVEVGFLSEVARQLMGVSTPEGPMSEQLSARRSTEDGERKDGVGALLVRMLAVIARR